MELKTEEAMGPVDPVHMRMLVSCWTVLDQVWEPADSRPCLAAQATHGLTQLIEGECEPRRCRPAVVAVTLDSSVVIRKKWGPLPSVHSLSMVCHSKKALLQLHAWLWLCPWPVHRSCLRWPVLSLQNGPLPLPISPVLGSFPTWFRQFQPLPRSTFPGFSSTLL